MSLLGSPYYPAIRFTQRRLFGASSFAFSAACQVARPLCRSHRSSSRHPNFHLHASDESVTLLAAPYNYYSHCTVLSKALSPFRSQLALLRHNNVASFSLAMVVDKPQSTRREPTLLCNQWLIVPTCTELAIERWSVRSPFFFPKKMGTRMRLIAH